MHRGLVWLVLGFAPLVEGSALAQPPRPGGRETGSRYGWLSSLEEGKTQARKSGKPLMVVLRCVP
jgi:hypothetical protein